MITTLRKAIFKQGYSLIIAAWMFTLSFVISNYWAFNASPEKVKQSFESYLASQEQDFERITTTTAALNLLLDEKADKSSLNLLDKDYGVFVYALRDSLPPRQTYWNTFNMNVSQQDLHLPDGYYPIRANNGLFEMLKKTIPTREGSYLVVGMIPIRWTYFIESKYFRNSFAHAPDLDGMYYIDRTGAGESIHNSKGQQLFKLSKYAQNPDQHPSMASLIFKLLGILFVLIFINGIINEITLIKGFYKGAFWLLVTVVLLRFMTYWLPIPFNYRSYELFSPIIYASNMLHSSLGDLLINTLLFFWITFFIKYRHTKVGQGHQQLVKKYSKVIAITALFLFALCTMNMVSIVTSLVRDSKIPINVADFFNLNIYTAVTFVILTFITLSFFNLSYFLNLPALNAGFNLYERMAIVVVSGLILITVDGAGLVTIKILALIWMVLYLFILQVRWEDLPGPLVASRYFLFWVMFFAMTFTAILQLSNNRRLEEKKRYAEALALQADNAGENLVKMAISNFTNFFWNDNFNRLYDDGDNRFVKDSLIMANFSGFLNKFNTRIYTFDANREPLYNADSSSFSLLNALVSNSKPTNVTDLYIHGSESDNFNYIYRKEISSVYNQAIMGYMFVVLSPRKYVNNNLSLELLNNPVIVTGQIPQNYSYAVYKNRQIFSNSKDFEFSDSLSAYQVPRREFKQINSFKVKELWYNAGNHTTVVITEKNSDLLNTITLFAYLFSSFVVVIVLLKISGFIIQSRFKWKLIKNGLNFNIRFQVHATLIFISMFSFIVIGISTISFFISRFNKSNKDKLMQSTQILAGEIEESLGQELPLTMQTPNELDAFYNSTLAAQRVIELANLNKQDVNLYDRNGNLEASSQPYIFNENIVSNKMHPKAFDALHQRHRIKFFQQETIGKLKYLSIYVPLYGKNKQVFGYLNTPALNSQYELDQEISSFLVTIINLNALIFLLAGAVASLLTFRITQSFSVIKEDMRKINLGIENEEIQWDRNDEIGDLVQEYNIMVRKLGESARALARSEREGAWKEMARQVAHEIKNPLTPMKLSLQFLQRSAQNPSTDIHSLSKRVSDMLIEQIDQLAKIASDFSQFANIHHTKPETFTIEEIIRPLLLLYNTEDGIEVNYRASQEKNTVMADKVQLRRVFTNLIKNALEASEQMDQFSVTIQEQRIEKNVMVTVADKGMGITQQEAAKIFVPNFTTKTSGTGLGLAICKGIVENAGGQIWFESEVGKGTTFYVSLPLYNASATD
ncbi:His Kinase A (phospho-acceptor) domain-containing protein [Arachidicoccus rhizosphaerae]|uniref:histidine kinase n=1 Tax=Arachidicoccus rhizosphaerae TaxID=551991 RepID=A0A1H3Z848_9BACT|nr:HAMP domain-containing sensor histidine kinase [Arachidicoccus rhizosphaerae]SEA19929.1 His Kinase A (phospho-acceptor) domain-containing protein [Arachidicoccus rhizosphaerae]